MEKYYIDTILINKIMLEEIGLQPTNIISSDICSLCNHEQIRSKRAEGENYGTSTMLITLV